MARLIMISEAILAINCAIVVGLSNTAVAESDAFCRSYATSAVSAFQENESRKCDVGFPFRNARWQPDYTAHYNWCRSAATEEVRSEERFRSNQLLVCRGDPRAVRCNTYAFVATSDENTNRSLSCGFVGPRWQSSRDNHLDWCIHANENDITNERMTRYALINVCSKVPLGIACDQYAQDAVAVSAEALARGCGLTGPRYGTSYERHLTWCVEHSDQADYEAGQRRGPVHLCSTVNPLPGNYAPPTPTHEACSWTATVANGICLNLDGSPSSVQSRSFTATGCGSSQSTALDRAKLSFQSGFGCLRGGFHNHPRLS